MPRVRDKIDRYTLPDGEEKPSRSARKRVAEAAQKLGECLVLLREAELQQLPLPDELRSAVRAARQIPRGPAQARQRQYIGKLMRSLDAAPIAAALERLPGRRALHAKMPR